MSQVSANPVSGFKKVKALLLGAGGDDSRSAETEAPASKDVPRASATSKAHGDVTTTGTPTPALFAVIATSSATTTQSVVGRPSTSGSGEAATPHTTGDHVIDATANIVTSHVAVSASTQQTEASSSGGVAGSTQVASDAMILANDGNLKMTVTTSATGLTPGTGVRISASRSVAARFGKDSPPLSQNGRLWTAGWVIRALYLHSIF